jgi:O-antigen/teichoic acid export membrane protein
VKLPARGFALDAASGYLRYAVFVGVFFVLTPRTIEGLGVEGFGLWTLVFSLVGFLGLLDFGMATGTVRFVARALARGPEESGALGRVVSTLLVAQTTLAGVALVVVSLLAPRIGNLFDLPPGTRGEAEVLVWLVAARAVLLALPLGVFRGLLYGGGRILEVNLVNVLSCLAYGVGAIAVLESPRAGVLPLAAWNLAAMLLEHVAYLLLCRRCFPGMRLSLRLTDPGLLWEALGFGASQLFVNVASLLTLRADPVLIKLHLPLTAVAVHALALKLSENLCLLIKQGANVLAPRAARLAAEDAGGMRPLLCRANRAAGLLAGLPTAWALLYADDLFRLWTPGVEGAGPVLRILATGVLLASPVQVTSVMLGMSGDHLRVAWISAAAAAANITLTAALIPLVGLTGAAIGSLGAIALVQLPALLQRCGQRWGGTGGGILADWWEALAPSLLSCLGIGLAVRAYLPVPGVMGLGLGLLGTGLAYLAPLGPELAETLASHLARGWRSHSAKV